MLVPSGKHCERVKCFHLENNVYILILCVAFCNTVHINLQKNVLYGNKKYIYLFEKKVCSNQVTGLMAQETK